MWEEESLGYKANFIPGLGPKTKSEIKFIMPSPIRIQQASL